MNSYYQKSFSQTKIMKGFASCFKKEKKEAYRPLAEMWLLLVIWCFLYPLKTTSDNAVLVVLSLGMYA